MKLRNPTHARLGGRVALGVLAVAVVALAGVALISEDEPHPTAAPEPAPTPSTRSAARAPDAGPTSTRAPLAETTAPTADRCDRPTRIRSWPLDRRLAALLVVGVDPSGPADAEAATAAGAGGVFVGGEPMCLLTSGRLSQLRSDAPLGLFVSVDDEGGRVQRIEAVAGPLPSPRDQADMTVEEVRALAARRGRALASLGVDLDLAPVVDVTDQPDDSVIGDRSYGDDASVVSRYAGAFAAGLRDAGVLPTLKHFPGHGAADGDSHAGAAQTPPLSELRRRDLVPYSDLIADGPTAVMLGHLDVPGLTNADVPASLSPEVVRLLRSEMGFDGLVITDDLSGMAAITARFGVAEAAVRAIAAGVDLALFASADVGTVVAALADAVADGRITEDQVDTSVARTLAAKRIDPCGVKL